PFPAGWLNGEEPLVSSDGVLFSHLAIGAGKLPMEKEYGISFNDSCSHYGRKVSTGWGWLSGATRGGAASWLRLGPQWFMFDRVRQDHCLTGPNSNHL